MTVLLQGNEPLRVLHVYRTYFPDSQGGGQELIRQTCLNTRNLNIENRIFTLSPNPEDKPIEMTEGTVIQAKRHLEISSCDISFSALRQFNLEAEQCDIIHYYFPWPFGDLLHLCSKPARTRPVVVSYLSDVVRQRTLSMFYKPLMGRFMKHINRIVATSPNYVESSPLLQQYRHKTTVIPIGLDQEKFKQPSDDSVACYRRQYGNDFFFFVGVFRYYKGLQYLLEAARHTSASIVIAGSGPEELALKNFARTHNLSNVHFTGRVNDEEKLALMAACKGFIFPSHLPSESFGIALLEASMMAKPMISCEIGTGTSWVNLHNETGLVVPPANPQALRDAMETLLTQPELASRFGLGARKRYEELFTGESLGRSYAALYREVAKEAPANRG